MWPRTQRKVKAIAFLFVILFQSLILSELGSLGVAEPLFILAVCGTFLYAFEYEMMETSEWAYTFLKERYGGKE